MHTIADEELPFRGKKYIFIYSFPQTFPSNVVKLTTSPTQGPWDRSGIICRELSATGERRPGQSVMAILSALSVWNPSAAPATGKLFRGETFYGGHHQSLDIVLFCTGVLKRRKLFQDKGFSH